MTRMKAVTTMRNASPKWHSLPNRAQPTQDGSFSHPRRSDDVRLDFSQNCLTRSGGAPIPLPRTLAVQLLEQLFRQGSTSAVRFLLLPRFRPSPCHAGYRQVLSGFRHELTTLRRMLSQFDLHIELERNGRRVRTRLDGQLRTNVMEAKALAQEAVARLALSEFGSAVSYAEKALAVDFDCVLAADVLVQILNVRGNELNADAVTRAHFCLARALVRCTAVGRRLSGRSYDPAIAKAVKITNRLVVRWEKHWHALLSWTCSERPCRDAAAERYDAVRDFVEIWVKVFRGKPLAYGAFAANPIVTDVVDQLLERRIKGRDVRNRRDAAENLTREILEKLLINVWLPAPARSPGGLRQQLLHFLPRRVDWDAVLARSRAVPELRDESHLLADCPDDAD